MLLFDDAAAPTSYTVVAGGEIGAKRQMRRKERGRDEEKRERESKKQRESPSKISFFLFSRFRKTIEFHLFCKKCKCTVRSARRAKAKIFGAGAITHQQRHTHTNRVNISSNDDARPAFGVPPAFFGFVLPFGPPFTALDMGHENLEAAEERRKKHRRRLGLI